MVVEVAVVVKVAVVVEVLVTAFLGLVHRNSLAALYRIVFGCSLLPCVGWSIRCSLLRCVGLSLACSLICSLIRSLIRSLLRSIVCSIVCSIGGRFLVCSLCSIGWSMGRLWSKGRSLCSTPNLL